MSGFEVIWKTRWLLLDSFATTLMLSAMAIGVGIVVGGLVAALRTLNIGILNFFIRIYVEVFRGTPLLMQLFFVYFGLPLLGYDIDRFWAAFIAIGLYTAAYVAEAVRGGIEAVPKGQVDAALALGLTFRQRLVHIVAPQALRIALPALVGVFVGVVKDTSLATVIGYNELMRRGLELTLQHGHAFYFFFVLGLAYFIICFPISKLSEWLERRLAQDQKRA